MSGWNPREGHKRRRGNGGRRPSGSHHHHHHHHHPTNHYESSSDDTDNDTPIDKLQPIHTSISTSTRTTSTHSRWRQRARGRQTHTQPYTTTSTNMEEEDEDSSDSDFLSLPSERAAKRQARAAAASSAPTSTFTCTVPTSTSTSTSTFKNIPGYHYDATRGKYYKITPTMRSHMSRIIRPAPTIIQPSVTPTSSHSPHVASCFQWTQATRYRPITPHAFQYAMERALIYHMKPIKPPHESSTSISTSTSTSTSASTPMHSPSSHPSYTDVSGEDALFWDGTTNTLCIAGRLSGLHSHATYHMGSIITSYQLKRNEYDDGSTPIIPVIIAQCISSSPVTSLHRLTLSSILDTSLTRHIPMFDDTPPHSGLVALTLLGDATTPGSFQLVTESTGDEQLVYRPKRGSVFTSQLHPHIKNGRALASLGGTKGARLLDLNTGQAVLMQHSHSDVLCQRFSSSGDLIFNGSRDGRLRTWDIRIRDRDSGECDVIRMSRSICWMDIMRASHDQQIIAATMDGAISQYDRRSPSRAMFSLSGHVNSYHQLTSCLNADQRMLWAGGVDGYIRAWDIGHGKEQPCVQYMTVPTQTSNIIHTTHHQPQPQSPTTNFNRVPTPPATSPSISIPSGISTSTSTSTSTSSSSSLLTDSYMSSLASRLPATSLVHHHHHHSIHSIPSDWSVASRVMWMDEWRTLIVGTAAGCVLHQAQI